MYSGLNISLQEDRFDSDAASLEVNIGLRPEMPFPQACLAGDLIMVKQLIMEYHTTGKLQKGEDSFLSIVRSGPP